MKIGCTIYEPKKPQQEQRVGIFPYFTFTGKTEVHDSACFRQPPRMANNTSKYLTTQIIPMHGQVRNTVIKAFVITQLNCPDTIIH